MGLPPRHLLTQLPFPSPCLSLQRQAVVGRADADAAAAADRIAFLSSEAAAATEWARSTTEEASALRGRLADFEDQAADAAAAASAVEASRVHTLELEFALDAALAEKARLQVRK
jgi:hypothetical protein